MTSTSSIVERVITLSLGCLSRFKEARGAATFRGTYHRKYCQGKLYSLCDFHISKLTNFFKKIGQSYYRQTIGIPQGSVLSSILCSFFYGDLEKKSFSFTNDPHSVGKTDLMHRFTFLIFFHRYYFDSSTTTYLSQPI